MKEPTLTFTKDEYLLLAKMLNIAQAIVPGDEYDDFDKVNKIYNDVCEKGFHELPETKSFMEMSELNFTRFDLSEDVVEETTTLTDLFEISVLQEHVPYSLADKDFEEMYGTLEPEVIASDPKLM